MYPITSCLLIASFAVSKKLEEKQARREAEERKRQEIQKAARKRNLLTFGIALLVGALVVFLIINDRNSSGGGGDSVDAGVAAEDAGCTAVEEFEPEGQEHVEDGTDVEYGTQPPSSGDHYGTPADAGFYDSAIPEEQAVHNLEHGQIVVWYSSSAPQETIDAIQTVVDDEAIALVGVPYDNLPSGTEVGFSGWAATQTCEDFSNDVLNEFRAEYQGKGPENVGIPEFELPDA
jgi:hypothetical protein